MEEREDKLRQLVESNEWTEEDRKWLLQYLNSSDGSELKTLLLQKLHEDQQELDPILSEQMLHSIHQEIDPVKKPSIIRLYIRWVAAAVLIGTITYLALQHKQKEISIAQQQSHPVIKNDVLPGKDQAILTLADGTKVALDDAQNGMLTQQGNTKILKLNGKLSYNTGKAGTTPAEVAYNTIATPRGGQYQIILPDGSQVWLNAASSLRFPTAFTGKERRVEVTGEAYFEIARNAAMPFTVALPTAGGSSEIQVLGTHFNVNAYTDESLLKTTLIQGAVRFVSGKESMVLSPGQQSQLTKAGDLNLNSQVDISTVMAWKNGLFHFEGADIETVMKQLSRWYDVDIVYSGRKTNDLFYAEIPRNTRLSDALKALSLTGKVDFKIDNKRIIVNQ
ncbi:MAG: DUF4974 domain-containing protein [Bacteroidetes bacterium]|nr:DUF4974 domain-containing protein [Bacteroidota bacterium]